MTEKKAIKGSGKKGGTVFPRISLEEAIPLAKKLVSKTHTSPQPADIILPGVLGASGPRGQVKASALKQYGLMEGKSEAYTASSLAKTIGASPDEERQRHLAAACLKPKVFARLFQTFHGDTVSLAKLKQQVSTAGVHPDFHDQCTDLFVKSIVFAGLGSMVADGISLVSLAERADSDIPGPVVDESQDSDIEVVIAPPVDKDNREIDDLDNERRQGEGDRKAINSAEDGVPHNPAPMRAVINVNVTLDSSLDTEKLERQLALLRRYGAL